MNPAVLELVTTSQIVPFQPTPPVVCGVMNKQLFVIGRDEARGIVRLVAIDQSGQAAELGALPIDFVEGITQCNHLIYLLGSQDQMFRRLQLKADGSVSEDIPLPIGPDLLLTPRLACGYGSRYELWIDHQGRLHISQDKAVATVALTDLTLDLVPLVTPSGLTLLRNAGIPGYLEFMRWENGRIQQTQAIETAEQGYSPLLFWQEDHYLLIWISRPTRTIQMQLFDPSLTPQGPAQALLSVQPPDGFRWIRGLPSNDGKILLTWQIERPGMAFSASGEPLAELDQSMALLDPVKQQLGASTAIGYQADSYFAGGWVEGHLIFVLGGAQATILVYKPI